MDEFWVFTVVLVVLFVAIVFIPRYVEIPLTLNSIRTIKSIPEYHEPTFNDNSSREMLESHYQEASPFIPVDYPQKDIGECPYSKPQASDLPIVDIPMCVITSKRSMRLV